MSAKKRWGFIINPIAGNGYAGRYAKIVEDMIHKRGLDAEIVFTQKKKHAVELSAAFADAGCGHIVAVGGDGTFNEAVQPLVGRDDIVFGAISAGTGNDFITLLGFSDHFTDKDWDIFFEENVIRMDVGKCNDRFFLNGMGLGFDAQVAVENYNTENGKGIKPGKKSKYWWHILKTLVLFREHTMMLTVGGTTTSDKSFLNTIAVGRRFAGGFFLTPLALADDGLLDICMINELSFPGRVRELLAVLGQRHTGDDVVRYFKTDSITLEFENEVPSHLDGELYFANRFDVSVLPRTLPIIYNPYGGHYFSGTGRG
jgi:diacylglycerol kinase (ATP)